MKASGFASESIPHGEAEATAKIIELLQRRLTREYANEKRMLRDAHPKQHGLVRAEFIVEPNLPRELQIGIFAEARTYPSWVRFSNMSDPPRADIERDSRGMGIKIMGVEGSKILDNEKDAKTQDFVLMSTDFFVTKGVAEFAKLVAALEGGTIRLLLHFAMNPFLLWLFLRVRQRCSSVLEIRYGSTTPYLFGTRAVKYSVRPTGLPTAIMPKKPSPDFLREQMAKHLSDRAARFEFMIQFQKDSDSMPIEDPRVVWSEIDSAPIRVASIEIPVQSFDNKIRDEYGDNLSFSPWHSLPQHRPLGGINRGRKVIYETMSRFRQRHNSVVRPEPTSWEC